MLWLLSALLLIIIVSVYRIEISFYKKKTTPLGIILGVTYINLFCFVLLTDYLGYTPLLEQTFFIITGGVFVFAVISILTMILNKDKIGHRYIVLKDRNSASNIIFKISIFAICILLLSILKVGISEVTSSSDAGLEFAGGGINGHMLNFLCFSLVHFISSYKGRYNILIIIIFLLLLLYQVKIWIFLPFVVSYLLKNEIDNFKISYKKFLLVGIGVFVVFILSYAVSLGFEWEYMEFFVNHFISYLFSGISGLNEAIAQNLPVGQNPIYGLPSILYSIIGNNYIVDQRYNELILNNDGAWTNVYGLIGASYLFNGRFYGIIYLIIIAIISYSLYIYKERNVSYWNKMMYYFWCIGLFFSFFGNYYTLFGIYELMVFTRMGFFKINNHRSLFL